MKVSAFGKLLLLGISFLFMAFVSTVMDMRINKSPTSIQEYNKAIELNPQDEKAYNNRGVVKDKLGDSQGASLDLIKARELMYVVAYGEQILCISGNQCDNGGFSEFLSGYYSTQCYLDRGKGIFTFSFIPLSDAWPIYTRLAVNFFDNNGRYLNHFVSSEYFPQLNAELKEGGVLQYPINMRDASFIHAAQIGFWAQGNMYCPQDEEGKKTILDISRGRNK